MLFDMRRTQRRSNPRRRKNPKEPELLVDGAAGIYVPQEFAQRFLAMGRYGMWRGITKKDTDILLSGPDHEDYWDTWDTVEGQAEIDLQDTTWYLYQDQDLWAIPEDFDLETWM